MSRDPTTPTLAAAPRATGAIPPSGWLLGVLAIVSASLIGLWPSPRARDRTMWTFAQPHFVMYTPIIEAWNRSHSPTIDLTMLGLVPMERRMLASFMSGTRSADLLEVERRIAARAFTGPLDAVGFVDLTDRIEAGGLREAINAPSFTSWTSRGRIFGLPHDVHPVMLGYRSDLVEAAGIDVSKIETWDDFIREMKPLMKDADGDGQPDRYLLNMWENHNDHLEVLLLQAGGGFFDQRERPVIDSEINAKVLARIAAWCSGPTRIAADAPDFTASGNKLKSDGYVVATIMPDWMCDVWRHELPGLAGKVKLMPLPAWERGGRRTSVWGGTMLGIPRTAVASPEDLDELFAVATHLYFSADLARELFRTGRIITPVKSHWSDPVFDEPDPYLSGQKPGRMYIDLAPSVPWRTSSPFNTIAGMRVMDALVELTEEARRERLTDPDVLLERARFHLRSAQRQIRLLLDHNIFHRPEDAAEGEDEGGPGA